jgi:hypothetical protein
MADKLEGRAKEILEEPHYAVISVPRKDGTVQTLIAWVHTDGDNVAFTSSEGRGWVENLRRSGTATVTVMVNHLEWVSVSGTLDIDTHEGTDEHVNDLSHKYFGTDYPFPSNGAQRVKLTLRPERVTYMDQAALERLLK